MLVKKRMFGGVSFTFPPRFNPTADAEYLAAKWYYVLVHACVEWKGWPYSEKTENLILTNSDTELGEEIATLALALVCFYVVTLAFISKEDN